MLWLVPLAVIGVAEQVAAAVGTAVAGITGLTFDGSTSGITGVLVFGAGPTCAAADLPLPRRFRRKLITEKLCAVQCAWRDPPSSRAMRP